MSMFSLFKKKRDKKESEEDKVKGEAVVDEQESSDGEQQAEPEASDEAQQTEVEPEKEPAKAPEKAPEELPSAAEDCAQVSAESHAQQMPAAEEQPETVEERKEQVNTKTQEKGEKKGFWARLTQGLRKTSGSIGSGLIGVFRGKKIDDDLFEELETQLLMADLGVATTTKIIDNLTQQADRKQLKDAEALYELLQEQLADILKPVDRPLEIPKSDSPYVILMTGVNGVGKTTTIGKLAKQFKAEGKSVMLAAGDTFRAAAVEQLQVWGERNDIPVIAQHTGADSASVLYDALEAAKARAPTCLLQIRQGACRTKRT